MGGRFFGEQATRLLRESWASTDELAEELYAMATAQGPLSTDLPLQLTRDGNQPAITIYDNSGSDTPPIQIIKGGQPDTGNSTCCSGSVGTQGSGGGGGGGGQKKKIPPPPPDTGGTVGGAGGGGTGEATYRKFFGYLSVRLHCDGDDPFGFNNQEPEFSGGGCFLYSALTNYGPKTAFAFPKITQDLNAFLAKPTLAPYLTSYEVIGDSVSGPFSTCDPNAPDGGAG